MKPMRVMLYGGCHALVIRDYFFNHFRDEFELTLLINFELIRSGQPFPFHDIGEFDAIIFSPIENRAGYNTSELATACKAKGVEAICFPWLEWHGYTPGGQKGLFKARHQWFYPELVERAAKTTGSFEDFVEEICETFPTKEALEHTVMASTGRIEEAERRHGMVVRISPFIAEHFRQERLFLIPDHPSRSLYIDVIRQILCCLGIHRDVIEDRLSAFPALEPQWRWRTPIFPRTAEHLGLCFKDPVWIDDEIVPSSHFDLRTYLRLYYHPESVILRPTDQAATVERCDDFCDGAVIMSEPVASGARLLARPLREERDDDGSARRPYELIQPLATGLEFAGSDRVPSRFSIAENQWSSTWL